MLEKNIMLAFVSPVNKNFLLAPIKYPDIQGKPYTAIQTNESAVVYVERMIEGSLEQIFLIASDAVKTGKVAEGNEFGDIFHIDFLKRRLINEFPYFDGKFFEIEYTDSGNDFKGLEKNILQIAEIADTITDYAKKFPNCTLRVHADMTGGFRHTSMLMLSIIQLLKYRGIETGEILYSDPAHKIVYRANEIQRVSLLITGADEFVKFGSVNALEEYFTNNPSHVTDNLLKAMRRFSDTIKLCRTGTIEEDLKNLGTHIQTFRKTSAKDLKSQLFEKIIDTIEFEYGNLIKGKATRFDIIRWCMKKGFWQQAMTLCTEWLPEEIIDRGIFKPTNQAVIDAAEIEGANFGRGWKQNFIISYSNVNMPKPVVSETSQENINNFSRELRAILEKFILGPIDDLIEKKYYGDLKKFLDEYIDGYTDFKLYAEGKIGHRYFKRKLPLLYKALDIFFGIRKQNPYYQKTFQQFINKLQYDNIISEICSLPSDKLLKIFNVDVNKISQKKNSEVVDKAERKWSNREQIYNDMLNNDIAVSNLSDRQRTLELLHDFYNLRNERNQINHATGTSEREIGALKNMIENYLDKLEKI